MAYLLRRVSLTSLIDPARYSPPSDQEEVAARPMAAAAARPMEAAAAVDCRPGFDSTQKACSQRAFETHHWLAVAAVLGLDLRLRLQAEP